MRWLEHRIPPPIVGALTALGMWWLARQSAAPALPFGVRLGLAVALAIIGLAFLAPAGAAFRRARTTVNPLKPEAASALVVAGVYRFTRNPMYVGFAALLLAWAAWLAVPIALLGPAFFVAFLTRFQIVPEERALRERFGESFDAYCRQVRRWL
jgi:protein-S-isoprenylcysteine O-methyltransferase Ste14